MEQVIETKDSSVITNEIKLIIDNDCGIYSIAVETLDSIEEYNDDSTKAFLKLFLPKTFKKYSDIIDFSDITEHLNALND